MNRKTKFAPESATRESNSLRNFTASAKLTHGEFNRLEQRAMRAGKRVGDWCREVLLRELSGQDLEDVVLAEVLGVRMIVLNMLAPILRGEKLTMAEFQKLLTHVDTN
jgi:hypothetical protein